MKENGPSITFNTGAVEEVSRWYFGGHRLTGMLAEGGVRVSALVHTSHVAKLLAEHRKAQADLEAQPAQ